MNETIFWAVKTLKDAKKPVMKQFNSTSGKTVILPLYSTVELEDRMSHYWRNEFWWNSFIHRQSIHKSSHVQPRQRLTEMVVKKI